MRIDIKSLKNALDKSAAFRRICRLQPAGGTGDKIFPPTYPIEEGTKNIPSHVFELRRIGDREVWCVLIDSVQSQANRLEEALLDLADGEGSNDPIPLPYITVDFRDEDLEPLKRITSLDAPHRIYDAILRDSLLNSTPFMESKEGRRLAEATPADATALLEISPTALVFGSWHSQGKAGGGGTKFPRTLVSEIMGIDTPVEVVVDRKTQKRHVHNAGRRTGSRIDPLGIRRGVPIYKRKTGWSTDEGSAENKVMQSNPSEINHGNIVPSIESLGVTCDYAEHRTTITLAGIRRLRFGGGERDVAGRALIASLGLLAVAAQDKHGYALRSRCDLVCEGAASLELVHWDGSTTAVEFDLSSAESLYREAYQQAEAADFAFHPLFLKPSDKLVEIIRSSRQSALEGKDDEDGDGK